MLSLSIITGCGETSTRDFRNSTGSDVSPEDSTGTLSNHDIYLFSDTSNLVCSVVNQVFPNGRTFDRAQLNAMMDAMYVDTSKRANGYYTDSAYLRECARISQASVAQYMSAPKSNPLFKSSTSGTWSLQFVDANGLGKKISGSFTGKQLLSDPTFPSLGSPKAESNGKASCLVSMNGLPSRLSDSALAGSFKRQFKPRPYTTVNGISGLMTQIGGFDTCAIANGGFWNAFVSEAVGPGQTLKGTWKIEFISNLAKPESVVEFDYSVTMSTY